MIIPSRWGFCFRGNESAFTRAVLAALRPGFRYLEIGIGAGDCLRAVADILNQTEVDDWCIVGVDVPGYRGGARHSGQSLGVDSDQPPRSIALNCVGSAHYFQHARRRPDFVFIDACHCAACPEREFLAVERLINPGGIVCFHDTDPRCQHEHAPQPCGGGIEVRQAVDKLGLLTDARPGWKKFDETFGNFPDSHGCLFVQRAKD